MLYSCTLHCTLYTIVILFECTYISQNQCKFVCNRPYWIVTCDCNRAVGGCFCLNTVIAFDCRTGHEYRPMCDIFSFLHSSLAIGRCSLDDRMLKAFVVSSMSCEWEKDKSLIRKRKETGLKFSSWINCFFSLFPDGTSDSGASVSSFRIGEGKNVLFCYFCVFVIWANVH
jgi:hypothetical protein